jgi:hypothetical protein
MLTEIYSGGRWVLNMPSSNICEESVLLTPYGWRIAEALTSECEIATVDRHGKIVVTDVRLMLTEKHSRLAYVGTNAAFSAFVADTRLTASDGKRWTVESLVECGDVSKVYFENLVRMPAVVQPRPSVDDFWQCLSEVSAISTLTSIALRRRDPLVAVRTMSGFPRKKKIGDQGFAIVHKQELAKVLGANWREAITTLSTYWLKNGDEDRVEIERSAYYFALWLATALTSSGLGYSFQFDTLQHSSYVFVSATNEAPRPLQRGACAFYTPYNTRAALLTWNDSSLAPIAGGFLLAGG